MKELMYFKLIEQKRQQQEMSIREICIKAGITEMTYYKAKDGRDIGHKTFFKLCKIIGIKKIDIS